MTTQEQWEKDLQTRIDEVNCEDGISELKNFIHKNFTPTSTVLEEIEKLKQIEYVGDLFGQMGMPAAQHSVEDLLQIDKAKSYNKALNDLKQALITNSKEVWKDNNAN